MKNSLLCIGTLLFMLGINYAVSSIIGWNFIDLALFIGLTFIIVIRYFTSTGGLSSNMVRVQAQAMTGIKVEEEKETFKPSFAYYTAIVYTLVSLIVILVYYKDYLF